MHDDAGAAQRTTTYLYDVEGNLAATVNPRGWVSQTARDALGRAVLDIDARGNEGRQAYDAAGNKSLVIETPPAHRPVTGDRKAPRLRSSLHAAPTSTA